jgi:hypothetical protein
MNDSGSLCCSVVGICLSGFVCVRDGVCGEDRYVVFIHNTVILDPLEPRVREKSQRLIWYGCHMHAVDGAAHEPASLLFWIGPWRDPWIRH